MEDEMDQFSVSSTKSLLQRLDEKKKAEEAEGKTRKDAPKRGTLFSDNPEDEGDDKHVFKEKVKEMQTQKALGKVLCNVGNERFQRIKKDKLREHV